jgi:leucyl aminopeptidase
MEISAVSRDIIDKECNITILPVFVGFSEIPLIKVKQKDVALNFTGKEQQMFEYSSNGKRHLLLGFGEKKDYSGAVLRRVVSLSARYVARQGHKNAAILLSEEIILSEEKKTASVIAETIRLSLHSAQLYKTKDKEEFKLSNFYIVAEKPSAIKQSIEKAVLVSDAVNFAKDLINTPANTATPEYIVGVAKKNLKKVSFTVLGRKEILKEGLNLFEAVSRGSKVEPQFLVIEYKPLKAKNKKPYCLVGKGITFDTGGVSLKTPSNFMRNMKDDMSGAASVIATLKVLTETNSDKWVIGIAPLTENAIGSGAYKVDDVVKSHFGLTVEIVNTDAEGRLVLADALSYARRFKPEFIVDVATLTGAARIAIGDKGACLMSNNDEFASKLEVSSFAVDEKMWRLPLWKEYNELIRSEIADMMNVSEVPGPGTIIGGLFLQNFVEKETPWAHLDIAAVAFYDKEQPLSMKGASGFGIRTLIELVENY